MPSHEIDARPPSNTSLPSESPEQGPSAFVQEADCAERVMVLKVRVPGRTSFVIVGMARSGAVAGLLTTEVRKQQWGGRLPPGFIRERAREEALEGAKVLGIGAHEIVIEQRGDRRVVRAHGGRIVVTDPRDEPPPTSFLDLDEAARTALEERGAALVAALAEDALEIRRTTLVRALEKAATKIERRAAAIRTDLAKIDEANRIASQASWFIAEAKRAPRGARKLEVVDWTSGEAVPLVIPLDPAKSAQEQVEAMFKRAKRLRLGGRIADARLAQTRTQLEAVTNALASIRLAATLPDIEQQALDAKRAAPRDVALPGTTSSSTSVSGPGKRGADAGRRTPFRTFVARSGRRVLVGKGASDNDTLTTKVARPHDLWLHAKDRTGAHVIVPLEKGEACPSEDLVDAAHLAAHFSDARDEKTVDVQYTPRRYLRKPKGSGPGFVVVDREKVLVLRVDADVTRALLEREEV